MKKYISALFFICLTLLVANPSCMQASKPVESLVEAVEVYSKKMDRNIKNIVILPAGYNKESATKYPVLYLLHGHGGNQNTWYSSTKKSLPTEATKWKMIIVCPNGENSWYWDSPSNPKSQFETYVSEELVSYIDSNYKTIASSKSRAITGFSMGGHGGLWIGINHPDIFGACGSMSGGVDIRPFPGSWNMKDQLGSYKQNSKRWDDHTVATQLDKIRPNTLAIIIDCGTEDFFFQVNENLHKEMLSKKIAHDYITRPGGHSHTYWNNAVDYQMQFFYNFFNQ